MAVIGWCMGAVSGVRCQDGGCKHVGVIPCSKYGIAWLGVECKWYFTVMAAMMNVKEAGSLFARVEGYQRMLLSTVYNSQNWPGLTGKVARLGCYGSMMETGCTKFEMNTIVYGEDWFY